MEVDPDPVEVDPVFSYRRSIIMSIGDTVTVEAQWENQPTRSSLLKARALVDKTISDLMSTKRVETNLRLLLKDVP